jgi:hypothetical protein
MITTHDTDKARLLVVKPGISTWRNATLSFGIRYVFINHGLKDGRSWVYQTSILWDSRDVLDFCRYFIGNPSAKIIEISLLEPVREGNISTWRWTRVLQIHLYEEESSEHPVYFTDAGEALGLRPKEAKRQMKSVYKARRKPT